MLARLCCLLRSWITTICLGINNSMSLTMRFSCTSQRALGGGCSGNNKPRKRGRGESDKSNERLSKLKGMDKWDCALGVAAMAIFVVMCIIIIAWITWKPRDED